MVHHCFDYRTTFHNQHQHNVLDQINILNEPKDVTMLPKSKAYIADSSHVNIIFDCQNKTAHIDLES